MSTYKIGQFAKLVRRTPATIRRWEAEGKIASKRLPSGHRYFDDSDLRAVMG
ncbi:MerR family DNA-binding transcriptional regulator, partial [Anaerobiospirillum succiniciproducens]